MGFNCRRPPVWSDARKFHMPANKGCCCFRKRPRLTPQKRPLLSTTLLALPNLNKTKAQTIEPFLHLLPFNVFRLDGSISIVFPTLAKVEAFLVE